MLKRLLLVAFFYLLFLADAIALSFSNSNDVVKLTIIPQIEKLSNDIETVDIIAKVEIKQGWHLYWKNPGDTGEAAKIEYTLPSFFDLSSYTQSSPIKNKFEDIITSFIYEDVFYFKHSFQIGKNKLNERINISAKLKYSACKNECFPGEITVDGILPISDIGVYNLEYSDNPDTFPKKISSSGYIKNNVFYLKFEEANLSACKNIEFISENPKQNIISNLPETIGFNQDNFLQIKFDEKPINYNGLIYCDKDVYEVSPRIFDNVSPTNQSFFYYIFIAFIAGLILNLMPCVLPILSLKALYIVKHRKKSVISALLYLLGVISSFLLLSSILFYLKTKGEELGWGFQLQSPTFNIFLLLFFFIIFLLMSDIIYIPDRLSSLLSKIPHNQSFLMGFFAVIIACPCTGPFMGAALGYAITQPALIYFSIFIFLALGYALPYVLIELFPNVFITFLPKPGLWMIRLKHFFAIPIALTCLWLGWIIFNQLSIKPYFDIQWKEYSKKEVDIDIKDKRPILINFTAKWCLVCLLNDKTTLATNEFKQLVNEKELHLYKADWTNRNQDIKDALASYGRNSIPLYVYYPKGESTPIILPQILTNKILSDTIK